MSNATEWTPEQPNRHPSGAAVTAPSAPGANPLTEVAAPSRRAARIPRDKVRVRRIGIWSTTVVVTDVAVVLAVCYVLLNWGLFHLLTYFGTTASVNTMAGGLIQTLGAGKIPPDFVPLTTDHVLLISGFIAIFGALVAIVAASAGSLLYNAVAALTGGIRAELDVR